MFHRHSLQIHGRAQPITITLLTALSATVAWIQNLPCRMLCLFNVKLIVASDFHVTTTAITTQANRLCSMQMR